MFATNNQPEGTMQATYSRYHEAEAYKMGCAAAEAAASWVIDGNTPQDHIARMVAMLDDGDPEAYDYLPTRPNLSGEWADAPTPNGLYREILDREPGEAFDGGDPHPEEIMMEICDAWEAGVLDTFETECERILRAAL